MLLRTLETCNFHKMNTSDEMDKLEKDKANQLIDRAVDAHDLEKMNENLTKIITVDQQEESTYD